ncbi:TorF family putative porin [Undibacterium arcticum]
MEQPTNFFVRQIQLYVYQRLFFGITDARGTGYLDLGANYDLGSGYTLNLHYGIGRVASTGAADNSIWNWKDYKVGVSKTFEGGWTLAGAYTKAKGATNVYDNFTTGALNTAGGWQRRRILPRVLFVASISKAF